MRNIELGNFNAISASEKNPYVSGEDILFYAYAPSSWSEQGLRKEVVVAKLPEHPNQIIIGPINAIKDIANAFNMLDSLYVDRFHRQISIIITQNFDTKQWEYNYWSDGKPASKELLEVFGLSARMDKSYYRNYKPGDNSIGVYADISEPIFLSPDYTELGEVWGNGFVPMYYACVIRHEVAHTLQSRNSLPVHSLWAERHAMHDQVEVLLKLLNSGRFKKNLESSLVGRIRDLLARSENYRNGKGFQDHITNNEDGYPSNDQKFFEREIEFGY